MPSTYKVKKKFFRSIQKELVQRLQLDNEARYSLTENSLARIQAAIIADCVKSAGHVPAQSIITDGTASIGGNVFAFVNFFMGVHAVEVHEERSHMLAHNVDVLDLKQKVLVWCGDIACVEAASRYFRHDVLFLDPPWTGTNYKNMSKLSLFLSGKSLMQVCNEWADNTMLIALKLPLNFDFGAFFHASQPQRYQQVECVVLGYRQKMFGSVACDAYVVVNHKLVTRMRHPKMILLVLRTTLEYA
jgi:16S rRNA G966 N2-methylase RsmD